MKINLAEYAGAGEMERKYLLESYNESKHKPDNSVIKVSREDNDGRQREVAKVRVRERDR